VRGVDGEFRLLDVAVASARADPHIAFRIGLGGLTAEKLRYLARNEIVTEESE